jgi:hypothetical protein
VLEAAFIAKQVIASGAPSAIRACLVHGMLTHIAPPMLSASTSPMANK